VEAEHHPLIKTTTGIPPQENIAFFPLFTPDRHINSIQPSVLQPINDRSSTKRILRPSHFFCKFLPVVPSGLFISFDLEKVGIFKKNYEL
jgi:hypothetical protein